jgi:hypothetical protein
LLRALHGRGERRSPDMGVQQDAPTNETIGPVTFYEIINFVRYVFGKITSCPCLKTWGVGEI